MAVRHLEDLVMTSELSPQMLCKEFVDHLIDRRVVSKTVPCVLDDVKCYIDLCLTQCRDEDLALP